MDIDQRIDTLERRLSAVERKSRAWRILALLLLVTLIGGVASEGVFDNASWAAGAQATPSRTIDASVIYIKDKNGAIRGQWDEKGLLLMDAERKPRTKITEGELHLTTSDGKGSIEASAQRLFFQGTTDHYSYHITVKSPPIERFGSKQTSS
jgi:hypothetical protein